MTKIASAGFPAVLVMTGQIGIPHLPVTEPTHDVLEDVASDHGLADLVFEPMQAAMSDQAWELYAPLMAPILSNHFVSTPLSKLTYFGKFQLIVSSPWQTQ